MDLMYWLEKKRPDLHLAVKNIRTEVEPLLRQSAHPDFTDHSVEHSDRVIKKLDDLTETLMNSADPLSPIEIYILLAAAYLHDLGMQEERYPVKKEWIREHHHELTRGIILEPSGQFYTGVLPPDLLSPIPGIIDAVARVAEAHRAVDLSQNEYEPFCHSGEDVRPRLLAALLRFADELDIDYRRAPMEMLALKKIPPKSLFHWYKSYYISGVRIKNGYVTVWYQFPKDCRDYERLIARLIDGKIQDEFAKLEGIFQQHGVGVQIGRSEVRYDIPDIKPMPPAVKKYALEQALLILERGKEEIDREIEKLSYVDTESSLSLR